MKQGIHPEYHPVVFMDSTTGFKFLSGSTKTSQETVEWEDGNTYPVIRVEVTSEISSILHWTSKIHSSRWTCRSFQQEIRSQRRQRRGKIKILFKQTLASFLYWELVFCVFKKIDLLEYLKDYFCYTGTVFNERLK